MLLPNFTAALLIAVLLFAGLVQPVRVSAADAEVGLKHHAYIPMVSGGSKPEMVQFRSCSGHFKVLPVGDLSAMNDWCHSGSEYPDLLGPNQMVAFSGLLIDNWSLVPHFLDIKGLDQQYKVTVGRQAPYLTITSPDGGNLSVSRGDEIYILSDEAVDVDGWAMTVHSEGDRPYVQFVKGQITVWVVLVDGFLWVEVQMPRGSGTSSLWQYALDNNGQLPSVSDFEQFIIAR